MARIGTISPEAVAVNEAREKLAMAIDGAIPGIEYLPRERLLEALEHFVNVKIVANASPRY